MRRKTIEIDGNRLQKALKSRRMTQEGTSLEIGYSQSYLSGCIRKAKMPETTAIMLEHKYGIKRHEYMVVREETVTAKDFDCETVANLIKEAAKHFDCTEWQAVSKVIGAMTEKNRAEALATQTATGIEYNALLFNLIMKKIGEINTRISAIEEVWK